jgi:hypothetical protein
MIDNLATPRSMVDMNNATGRDSVAEHGTVTSAGAAEYLGLPDAAAARAQLQQWGIRPVRQGGRVRWAVDQIAARKLTTTEVAAFLGLGNAASARVQLRRWRIESVGRAEPSGEKQWPAGQVIACRTGRPGRGARVDLHRTGTTS